jgi:hAT family C-terminal dimerisation region
MTQKLPKIHAKRFNNQCTPSLLLTYHLLPSNQGKTVESKASKTIFGELIRPIGIGVGDEEHTQIWEHFHHFRDKTGPFYNLLEVEDNPVIFWTHYTSDVPELARIALALLKTTANSCSSERSFNQTFALQGQRRCSLSAQNHEMLTFMHSNSALLELLER